MSVDVINTSMKAGGNIALILEMIFMSQEDNNPASELNMLEESLDDARSTYDMLEMELLVSSKEDSYYTNQRTDKEVRRDIHVCSHIIEELEKMIAVRVNILKN